MSLEEDREEIRRLYTEWEEASATEEDAASRVSLAEGELGTFGIDPNDPPDWLCE